MPPPKFARTAGALPEGLEEADVREGAEGADGADGRGGTGRILVEGAGGAGACALPPRAGFPGIAGFELGFGATAGGFAPGLGAAGLPSDIKCGVNITRRNEVVLQEGREGRKRARQKTDIPSPDPGRDGAGDADGEDSFEAASAAARLAASKA